MVLFGLRKLFFGKYYTVLTRTPRKRSVTPPSPFPQGAGTGGVKLLSGRRVNPHFHRFFPKYITISLLLPYYFPITSLLLPYYFLIASLLLPYCFPIAPANLNCPSPPFSPGRRGRGLRHFDLPGENRQGVEAERGRGLRLLKGPWVEAIYKHGKQFSPPKTFAF